MASSPLVARWLGRVSYAEGLAVQQELVARKLADRSEPDHLLLLEHEPVFTIGRTQDQSSLGDSSALPYPVHVINRGGQATYHGPGQLVGYPILDLSDRGRDLHRYIRTLEAIVIDVCAAFGVATEQRPGLTGVWAGERKIASLGVGVRRWITMHGLALNVCGILEGFSHITPCGIGGVEMTSLEQEGARGVTVRAAAEALEKSFPPGLDTIQA